MTKRVLFIVYSFPPAGGPGVQRPAKFAKYLPQFDWRPIVVTVTPDAYPVLDATLMTDIPPETPIYRQKSYDVRALRPTFEKLHIVKALSGINTALQLPDAAMFWARFARATVRKIIEKHHPDILFSSSPPASAHLLAQWAHHTFGLPWVADFRDPWSENPLQPYLPGYKSLNRRMESKVLANADGITTVSPPLVDMLQRLSGRERRVYLIENGYDDDVARFPPPQTGQFTITYTGEFSPLRRPDAFVQAVDRLVKTNRIPIEDWRVCFAGKNPPQYIPDRPPFQQLGYLNHQQLNDIRRDSDILLLLLSDSPAARGNYTGKLFEYLASNRPVLSVARSDNVAAQLVSRARAGRAVPHDPDQIADAIEAYYRAWKAGQFAHAPDWDVIEQFSRYNLTKRLAGIFNSLTSN